LCQFVVVEERAVVVGDDKLVGRFAIADRVGVLLVVFDQTDDFELQRLAVVGLDNQDVAQLQRSAFAALAGPVSGAVRSFDDGLLKN
jgi:hypothetical protein